MEELGLFGLRIDGLLIFDPNTNEPIDARATNVEEPIGVVFHMTGATTNNEARMIGRAVTHYPG